MRVLDLVSFRFVFLYSLFRASGYLSACPVVFDLSPTPPVPNSRNRRVSSRLSLLPSSPLPNSPTTLHSISTYYSRTFPFPVRTHSQPTPPKRNLKNSPPLPRLISNQPGLTLPPSLSLLPPSSLPSLMLFLHQPPPCPPPHSLTS